MRTGIVRRLSHLKRRQRDMTMRKTLNSEKDNGTGCRQAILGAAGRLFWRKGYLATSVDDLANGAKVTKGSVYYYFKNKNSLLYEIMSKAAQVYLNIVATVAESELTPEEKLKKMVSLTIRWQASNLGLAGIAQIEQRNLPPKLLRAYIDERDKIEAGYRKVVSEIARSRALQTASPKVTAMLVLGVVLSVMRWYKAKGELSAEEVASEAARFVDNALNDCRIESGETKQTSKQRKLG